MRRRAPALALGLLAGLLAARAEAAVAAGDPAPVAAISGLVDLKGQPVEAKDALAGPAGATPGRAVLVVFWATWCQPCIHEVPVLNELQRFYGGRGLSVVAIGTSGSGETVEKASEAAQRHGMTYRVLFDGRGEAAKAFEVAALPGSVLLDGRGVVRWIGPALPGDIGPRIEAALEAGRGSGAE